MKTAFIEIGRDNERQYVKFVSVERSRQWCEPELSQMITVKVGFESFFVVVLDATVDEKTALKITESFVQSVDS